MSETTMVGVGNRDRNDGEVTRPTSRVEALVTCIEHGRRDGLISDELADGLTLDLSRLLAGIDDYQSWIQPFADSDWGNGWEAEYHDEEQHAADIAGYAGALVGDNYTPDWSC